MGLDPTVAQDFQDDLIGLLSTSKMFQWQPTPPIEFMPFEINM